MKKQFTVAGCMLLLWLTVTLVIALKLRAWFSFAPIVACTAPMLLFPGKLRGATFGARDTNTVKYKRGDYIAWFVFAISGSATISIALTLLSAPSSASSASSGRGDFFFLLVFSCLIPAFFEEYLMRGGVLGAIAEAKGTAVVTTAFLFSLMHLSPRLLPHTFFAGLCITALVYLSENVYLGMLLHFLNNFFALLLTAFVPDTAEYVAVGVIVAAFLGSAVLLFRSRLFADAKALLKQQDKTAWKAFFNVPIVLFVIITLLIGISAM